MSVPAPDLLPPRRAGLRRWLIFAAVAVVVVPVTFAIRRSAADGYIRVATMQAVEAQDVMYLEDLRVFLVDTRDTPLALLQKSSHLGDPVLYCESSQTFVERHAATWDRNGYYLAGPGPRGLDHVQVRVREGYVEVDPGIVSAGPPRGTGPPSDPTGPLCGAFEDFTESRPGFAV